MSLAKDSEGSRVAWKEPASGPAAGKAVARNLQIDVKNGQANIVEVVDLGHGESKIRRLREQELTAAERILADQLKRHIVYGHKDGSYCLEGLYPPDDEAAAQTVLQLVEELEKRFVGEAWDRRRYPR